MVKTRHLPMRLVFFFALAVIFACDAAKTVDLEVQLAVTLDGEPVPQAKVILDGREAGVTGADGRFLQKLQKQPGEEVPVAVKLEADGYRVEPWQDSFVTKLTKGGVVERYDFDVRLKGVKYFSVYAEDDGRPVAGAAVSIPGAPDGQTDASGVYVHEYTRPAGNAVDIRVSKNGYQPWKQRVQPAPGQRYVAVLEKKSAKKPEQKAAAAPVKTEAAAAVPAASAPEPAATVEKPAKTKAPSATLTVSALTEAYGVSRGLSGLPVYLNGRKVGTTNRKGVYVYSGSPVKDAHLKISAAGYIPQTWESTLDVQGKKTVGHHFYPATPNPIRAGIHGFVNNSPEKDLSDVIERVESAIGDHLFAHACFKEVSQNQLKQLMRESNLDMETVATKGWQNTALDNIVDVIVSGSVTADDTGMTIETTVITADGRIILSQINRARKVENIGSSAKVIVNGIVNQFPFEGTIAAVDVDGYRVNLGTAAFKIRRGNEFRFMSVQTDGSGRISGFREAGLLRVVDTEDAASRLEAVELKPDQPVVVGDRVVRRVYLEQQKEIETASAVILVKGGIFPDEKPLWGVNVYLGSSWMGTTGADGKVQIPLSLYTEHDLLLSRHGYKPVQDVISVDADRQTKEFYLEVASALFRAESEPSNAEVFVDGVKIGTTPMLEGKLVTFGFRKIRLAVGGDYRDWDEVIEVQQPEVDRTGDNRIVFVKDYLKIGKKAEAAGEVDAAMRAYSSAEKGNPDYSVCRCRLAQLHMDEKGDFDAAIGEYENVLALPENRQIIYKQFAVTYTNLGHAYYEKGNALVQADPQEAARNFAKAIEKLTTAKQNTRFFPSERFDEAVHDTYYYTALAYHKLYLVTKKRALIHKTDIAWREYFDFFPKALANKGNFAGMRDAGEKYWAQIKSMM